MKRFLLYFCILSVMLGSSCALQSGIVQQMDGAAVQHIGLSPADPWEFYNRKVFTFNDWLDTRILVPIAKGYDIIMPSIGQTGVRNFFSNLSEIHNMANNLLQLDAEDAGTSFMRFSLNTTFGFFGVLDIATETGMRKDREDFAQTLGVWGVGAGNYLVLPFFGSSSTRDISRYADMLYYDKYKSIAGSLAQRYSVISVEVVQKRSDLIALESQIQMAGDRYSFIRDAYLQNREFLTNDGASGDVFVDDDDEVSEDDF